MSNLYYSLTDRIPFHVRKKVEEKIQKLLEADAVDPAEGPPSTHRCASASLDKQPNHKPVEMRIRCTRINRAWAQVHWERNLA